MEYLVLVALVDALTQAAKKTFVAPDQYKELIFRGIAIFFGLVLSLGFGLDLMLDQFGWVATTPIVGQIFSGVIIGLLGTTFYDLVGKPVREFASLTKVKANGSE